VHEASLVDALFDEVDDALAARGGGALCLLRVRIGALAGVEEVLFRSAFEVLRAARGHPAAVLELEREATLWRCVDCGEALAEGATLVCPRCGGAAALVAGGDIVLLRMELEVRDV
jgi:hydrogenase nickel incorporation protein HypA/HybF